MASTSSILLFTPPSSSSGPPSSILHIPNGLLLPTRHLIYPSTKKHPLYSSSNNNRRRMAITSSSQSNNNNNNNVNMDRRELIAASVATGLSSVLIPSLASASPVATPNLNACQLSEIAPPPGRPGATSKILCCLPKPSKAAKPFHMGKQPRRFRVRKPAHMLDAAYVEKYNRAYQLMKELPATDPRNFMRQADVHCAFCNNAYTQPGSNAKLEIHFSCLFFPWHRWYLYFHERILASLIHDPSFTLPFWAWDDQQTGGNVMPPVFMRQNTTVYNTKRNQNHIPPAINTLNFNPGANPPDNQIIQENLNEMYQSIVTATTPSLFFGGIIRAGETAENPGLGGTVENGPHSALHAWTGDPRETYGEDMGNFYSAGRDPIFYAHHANVDRMWDVWKSLGGRRRDHDNPDYLNAEFYFFDEKAELVKVNVRDSLSSARLGYTYQKMESDKLWINYNPPPSRTTTTPTPTDVAKVLEIGAAGPGKKGQHVGKKLASSVQRKPKKSRKKGEEHLEEVLVLEGVEVPKNVVTQILIFINLLDADENTPTNIAEYAGSFYSIPHFGHHGDKTNLRTTNIRLAISDNLHRLGITDVSKITVTVVKRGEDVHDVPVKINGIRVEYE